MTGREKTHSLLSGAKVVCVPDASCLSRQHFLLGEPTGSNETEPASLGPSPLTAAASHGHWGPLAPRGGAGGERCRGFRTGLAFYALSFYQRYTAPGKGGPALAGGQRRPGGAGGRSRCA